MICEEKLKVEGKLMITNGGKKQQQHPAGWEEAGGCSVWWPVVGAGLRRWTGKIIMRTPAHPGSFTLASQGCSQEPSHLYEDDKYSVLDSLYVNIRILCLISQSFVAAVAVFKFHFSSFSLMLPFFFFFYCTVEREQLQSLIEMIS